MAAVIQVRDLVKTYHVGEHVVQLPTLGQVLHDEERVAAHGSSSRRSMDAQVAQSGRAGKARWNLYSELGWTITITWISRSDPP